MLKRFLIVAASFLTLATVAFPSQAFSPKADFVVSWAASIPVSSKGYGLVLRARDVATSQPALNVKDWRHPESAGGFAVGFNTYDPPTTNPFDADCNIENNPQREVSLGLDGREIANRLSPVGFGTQESTTTAASKPSVSASSDSSPATMRLSVHFVCGGAEVTLCANDRPIYDGYFVPQLSPTDFVVDFGGDAKVSDIESHWGGPAISVPVEPLHVSAFDHVLIDGSNHKSSGAVEFPPSGKKIGRVIATIRLDKTPAGVDPWDRIGTVYVIAGDGRRTELLRYITPYRKAWEWKTDVTDMLPLLQGHQKLELECVTGGAGWLTSVDFAFYTGDLDHIPFKVTTIWDRTILLGQKNKPINMQLPPTPLVIDPDAKLVKLRTLVTGHGGSSNAQNAGEFFPLWRTVRVGEKSFSNRLWKTDNYLNPCRPQGGTWKYSRAGWGPGTVVEPWSFDITDAIHGGVPTTVSYEIEPYDNPTPEAGFPAQQQLSVQLIQYR